MALLITLALLVLITILIVGFTTVMMDESTSAHGHRDRQQALTAANMGFDSALSSLRDAIGTNVFWSSQPGQIVIFSSSGTALTNALYSVSTNGTVNLNQVSYSGIAPVGGSQTNAMPVDWINVFRDPTQAVSSNNPIASRYAWWVDDESSKINLQSADGTARGTTNSYGEGMPSEVNLAALGGSISNNAAVIVSNAWTNGFASEAEVVRAAGVTVADGLSNRFNLTAFSRSPEMNFFGEPKIYLFPAVTNGAGTVTNIMVGPYASAAPTASVAVPGGLLNQIYPTSAQLPAFTVASALATNNPFPGNLPLPQFFYQDPTPDHPIYSTNSSTFPLAARIAQYLAGYNGQGQSINWPVFPGSGNGGFAAKYTPRQIDSIALQIADLVGSSLYADSDTRYFSAPAIMAKGFVSGEPVFGVGRGPRITQVLFEITPTLTLDPYDGNYLSNKIQIFVEWYFPPQFAGVSIPSTEAGNWVYGSLSGGQHMQLLNSQDAPQFSSTSGANVTITNASMLSTNALYSGVQPKNYWMDNMLRITDQKGNDAGVDLFGNDPAKADPDPRATNHPYAMVITGGVTNYMGTGTLSGGAAPALAMNFTVPSPWQPGQFVVSCNTYASLTAYPTKPGTTSINVSGGLAIWANSGQGYSTYQFNPMPFDSLHGTTAFNETLASSVIQQKVLQAVLPINLSNVKPGTTGIVHLWVPDPFVNEFPSDWHVDQNANTLIHPTNPTVGTNYTTTTLSPMFTASGADPGTWWMPPQTNAIPKTQRFSSAGLLQYVHTGAFPDRANDPDFNTSMSITNEVGTPWRVLNFSPSTATNQQTAGGQSYPDWALLDLFTVPATLQPLNGSYRNLTYGGATSGRINPNGAAIAPSSWNLSRTPPLAALFQGLPVVSYSGATPSTNWISASTATNIAAGVSSYLRTNGIGAFRTAGEIANVPEITAYLSANQSASARSRNDIVRQVVGLLSPQSSTFSIWVVGQSIQKARGNTSYGMVEPGDTIGDEIRMRYVIERYLDLGTDGAVGNVANPGPDGVAGTWDDVVDASNPSNPTYKYRVIYAEQVGNN